MRTLTAVALAAMLPLAACGGPGYESASDVAAALPCTSAPERDVVFGRPGVRCVGDEGFRQVGIVLMDDTAEREDLLMTGSGPDAVYLAGDNWVAVGPARRLRKAQQEIGGVLYSSDAGPGSQLGGNGDRPQPEPSAEPKAEAQQVDEGGTVTLHDRNRRHEVDVTLHKVSYPEPGRYDRPERGRVFVVLEMRIENRGARKVYGVPVYPDFETDEGRFIEDTGWHIAAFGRYGSGDYREELPDTVPAGTFVQGYALYEVPPEPGTLIFPYGPSTLLVHVDPTR